MTSHSKTCGAATTFLHESQCWRNGDRAFDYLYYIPMVDNYKRSALAKLVMRAADDRICSEQATRQRPN